MSTQRRRGQSMIEYAVIITVITLSVIIAMVLLRTQLQGIFSNIATNLDAPQTTTARWCAWSMADGHVYATRSDAGRDCLHYDASRVRLVKGATIDEALQGNGVVVRLEGQTLLQRSAAGAIVALEPGSPLLKQLETATD